MYSLITTIHRKSEKSRVPSVHAAFINPTTLEVVNNVIIRPYKSNATELELSD